MRIKDSRGWRGRREGRCSKQDILRDNGNSFSFVIANGGRVFFLFFFNSRLAIASVINRSSAAATNIYKSLRNSRKSAGSSRRINPPFLLPPFLLLVLGRRRLCANVKFRGASRIGSIERFVKALRSFANGRSRIQVRRYSSENAILRRFF